MLSIILQVLLGLGFIMFGYQKFVSEDMKQGFKYFGYGDGFRVFTGLVEIGAAILIIIGIWVKLFAVLGGGLMFATMIGAILTHVKMKDGAKSMMMPLMLLILSVVVVALNWSFVF